MRARGAAVLIALLLLSPGLAFAHRIDEYLQATLLTLEPHSLQGSIRLVPGVLVASDVIASIDANGDGVISPEEQRAYAQQVLNSISITLDGRVVETKLVSWSFPSLGQMHDGLGEIKINYSAALSDGGRDHVLLVATHNLRQKLVYLINLTVPEDRSLEILSQRRNPEQSVYEVDYEQKTAAAGAYDTTGAVVHVWLQGIQFSPLFHLGMRHIAEGTDHLLFLLTLLLPAPLLAINHRWGPRLAARSSMLRILGIVTAFTIGHSITLTLAAMNVIHVPSHPIEVLIAVSILVSAVHALWPILPGREAWIAAFFGLIHGLAFAATLDRLGVGHWERVAGILSFNLGIEAMQMIVVAAILPSLLLMSRTRAYSALRIVGAGFAAIAALGWTLERLFELQLPVDDLVNALARHALWIATGLFLLSLLCRVLLPVSQRIQRVEVLSELSAASTLP